MKTFTAAAKIFGMTLTEKTEISDVCRHLDDCHTNYGVGAGGIVIYGKCTLHKVNGTWCFIVE
jgi:hypothetical protein